MLQKQTRIKQSALGCVKINNSTTQSECSTNEKNIMIEPALKAIENSPFLPTLLNYFKSIDHNASNITTTEKEFVEENLEKKLNDTNLLEETNKDIQVNRKQHTFAENTDLTPGVYVKKLDTYIKMNVAGFSMKTNKTPFLSVKTSKKFLFKEIERKVSFYRQNLFPHGYSPCSNSPIIF